MWKGYFIFGHTIVIQIVLTEDYDHKKFKIIDTYRAAERETEREN